jgi:glycosyltransferase involved in cell wall biosynthesis
MIHEDARQRAIAILKNITARILCARRHIRRLFVLDELSAVYATRYFKTNKIRYLADPSAFDSMATIQDISTSTDKRHVFLIAGALSKRKGILPVLEALILLSRETQAQIRLKLVGTIGHTDRGDILNAIATARKTTSVAIDHIDEFVSDEAIDRALIESDVVLLLYQKFIGSSGMLIRAALHKRPVLATHFGLIGLIVSDEKLGLTVDPYNPRAIANAIACILSNGHLDFDNESARRFATRHTPTQYAEQLRDLIIEVAEPGDNCLNDKKHGMEQHGTSSVVGCVRVQK